MQEMDRYIADENEKTLRPRGAELTSPVGTGMRVVRG